MSDVILKPQPGILTTLSAAEEATLDERGVPTKLGRQFRRTQVADSGYDKDAHTVTMAVSSQTPVERYYGQEILSHAKGALRTDRLKNGVALLFNHDYDQHLGTSVDFKLRTDGTLEVICRFGSNPLALEKEGDVETRILKDVSIGYMVHEWEIVEDKNGNRTYTATDWEIYEVSLVTVPADPTVGVGRALDGETTAKYTLRSAEGDEIEGGDEEEEDDPDDDAARNITPTTSSAPTSSTTTSERTAMPETTVTVDLAAQKAERDTALRNLHAQYPQEFNERSLNAAIALDADPAQVRSSIFTAIVTAARSSDVPTISDEVFGRMSNKELREYSLRNVYAAAVNERHKGSFTDPGAEAGFEREVGESLKEAAKKRGITEFGGGIVIPGAASRSLFRARQQRALASGGNVGNVTNFTTIETDPIELLRTKTACLALGAEYWTGLHGQIRLPRQNAAGASSWLAEGGTINNSDPGLDYVTLAPNRLDIMNSYYRDLLAQSGLAVDPFLAKDRQRVMAITLDTVGLAGSGTAPVPLGILNLPGLAAVLSGSTRAANGQVTAGAGGVPTTYVDWNAMEAAISTANADIGTMGIVMTPKIRAALRNTPKIAGAAAGFIFPDSKPDARGIQEGPLGYNTASITNPVLTGFTSNGQAGCHASIMGVWGQLVYGDWDLSELIVDPYTGAQQALIKFIERGYYGLVCTHTEAFCANTSILPS